MTPVILYWLLGNGRIIGKDRVQLIPRENGYPSRANFTNLSIVPGMQGVHGSGCGYCN